MALTRLEIGTADASPGSPKEEVLQLFGLDTEDRIALRMSFDVEDLDAAIAELDAVHARFEEQRPRPRQLENSATRVFARLYSNFANRDWNAVAETVAENSYTDDRRRVVNAGIRYARDAVDDLRALADVGFRLTMVEAIATRGERLALTSVRGSGQEPGSVENAALNIVEIDTGGRFAAVVVFDSDDFDSAIAELDARYLAGEAAPHARTWSVVAGTYASVSRHEFPSITPDCMTVDHRRTTAFGPGETSTFIRAGWDLGQDIRIFVETVHRLSDLGAVCGYAGHGVSHEGFVAEWRGVGLSTVEGDMVNRSELFDEADLDAAIARFDQLSPRPSRLENTASQVYGRLNAYFTSRDWESMANAMAENVINDDRRHMVNSGIRRVRDVEIANGQAFVKLGGEKITSTVAATRGARVALCRSSIVGRGEQSGAFRIEFLSVVEIDADERLAAHVAFDLYDFGAAITELDARFLAGEAAAYSDVWPAVAGSYAALNRHELPLTAPTCVNIDHRGETAFGPGDVAAYIQAGCDFDTEIYVEQVHRLTDIGAIVTYAAHETSKEGLNAEWRGLAMFAVERDMITRTEVFNEVDVDAALARFNQLSRPIPRLDNRAASVFEHVWSHFAVRDWDAMAKAVADNYVSIDHRRVVSAEPQHSRDDVIRDLRAAAEVGFMISMVSAVAIRGERLVLARVRASGRDPDAAQNDAFNIVEIDADDRIANVVVYDLEDFDAAITELDARYLAAEAAGHARTWSVITGGYAAVNRHELPGTTPDSVYIDHRTALTTEREDLTGYLPTVWDLMPDIVVYIEAVHRLSELGTVMTHAARGTSQGGFDAEWRAIVVVITDGDLYDRVEVFDQTDLDAALARFEELHRQAPRLHNAASQTWERICERLEARDSDALAELTAENISVDDRRRVVNAGLINGRSANLESTRALAEVGFALNMLSAIATRGARLALLRVRVSGDDPEAIANDALVIAEVDSDRRVASNVIFDLEDIDAAFAELESRYLAGEAAAHADTWSVATAANAQFNRHELPATTPNPVYIDHRRLVSSEGGVDLATSVGAMWDLTSDTSAYIESVHQLSELGAVTSQVLKMTSQEGFDAEWRLTYVIAVEGNLLSRIEVFDESNLDDALATFEQLSQPTRRLENAASQTYERFRTCFAARDWGAMADLLIADTSVDDHRRVVNAENRRGRDVEIANMQAFVDVGAKTSTATVIATRDQRLVLCRTCISGEDQEPGAFHIEFLNVIEIDADGRIVARIAFDADDVDAAFEELDARYLAGEAAAHSRTWSAALRAFDAFNGRQVPATTSDWVNIDHRRARAFSPGDLVPYIHAAWELAPEAKIYVEAVHRLNDVGAVVTEVLRGTSPEGFDAEWLEVNLITVDGDLINRSELFDEEDLGAALARFDELHRRTRRLENAASRVDGRCLAHFMSRDVAAITQILADEYHGDDRRRVVNVELRRGRDAAIEQVLATVDLGVSMTTPEVIATRGERLVLSRIQWSDPDHGSEPFFTDVLNLVEIGTDERIVSRIWFDPNDFDSAIEELDARYLAGEAATHSHIWSVVARAHFALNRREIVPTTPDWINIDHRHGMSFAPGELRELLASWNLAPDIGSYVAVVHRLNNLGAVVTSMSHETSQDGVYAEWRVVNIITIEGNLVNRLEVFDEADLGAALARFDQLAAENRPK